MLSIIVTVVYFCTKSLEYEKTNFPACIFGTTLNNVAQKQDLNFTRVSPPGGLNFQHIHSLTQDAEGNIWMGSTQGIYKYNTLGFKRFHHNPEDTFSLRNDIVNQLLVDQNNKLCVATNSGIDLFDYSNQSFVHFNYKKKGGKTENRSVTSFAFENNKRFWIDNNEGVGCLDAISRDNGELVFQENNPENYFLKKITDIIESNFFMIGQICLLHFS